LLLQLTGTVFESCNIIICKQLKVTINIIILDSIWCRMWVQWSCENHGLV